MYRKFVGLADIKRTTRHLIYVCITRTQTYAILHTRVYVLDLRLTVWHTPQNHFFMSSSSFFAPYLPLCLIHAHTHTNSLQPATFSLNHFISAFTSLPFSLSHLAPVVLVRIFLAFWDMQWHKRQPLYFSPSVSHPMPCDLFSFYLIWIYFSLSQCFGIYLTWSECWAAFKLTTMPNTNYTSATRSYLFSFRSDATLTSYNEERLWMAQKINTFWQTHFKLN